MYLTGKPSWFGDMTWPWVIPNGATHADRIKALPAKERYDDGQPFTILTGGALLAGPANVRWRPA